MKTCPDCNGDSVVEKGTDDEQQCTTCDDSDFVPHVCDSQEVIFKSRRHRNRIAETALRHDRANFDRVRKIRSIASA